jgi:hypothetical protein
MILLGMRWPIVSCLFVVEALYNAPPTENRTEGVLDAAATVHTRAARQQHDEGGQSTHGSPAALSNGFKVLSQAKPEQP